MRILHVTPHLGGGVGKAHAAIGAVLPGAVQQTFVLLEEPSERRYADALKAGGAEIVVARDFGEVAERAKAADIVQFEFWNHPRMFECLARAELPAMRTMFWSHISGLARPFIPQGLIEQAGCFAFTTPASLAIPSLDALPKTVKRKIWAINSGFGFADTPPHRPRQGNPGIAYLGTVDFVKMHPGFFDAIDQMVGDDIRVMVWGAVDPSGDVAARAQAMRHSKRIQFFGETKDPVNALSEADIFFYPLRPDHYGTAENALIEAMSLGLACVVLGNPAERAIVRDSETGLIGQSIDECAFLLQKLLASPDLRARIGQNAAREAAEKRIPAQAAMEFMILWLGMLAEPKRACDFRSAIGDTPADWFMATQGQSWSPALQAEHPSKGTLTHFERVFAGDNSLSQLRSA